MDAAVSKTVRWKEAHPLSHETAKRLSKLYQLGVESSIIQTHLREQNKLLSDSKVLRSRGRQAREEERKLEEKRTQSKKKKKTKKKQLYVGTVSTHFTQIGATQTESTLTEERYFPGTIAHLVHEDKKKQGRLKQQPSSSLSSLSSLSTLSVLSAPSSSSSSSSLLDHSITTCSRHEDAVSHVSSQQASRRKEAESVHLRTLARENKALLLGFIFLLF